MVQKRVTSLSSPNLNAHVAQANVDGTRQQAIAGALFELGSVVILAEVCSCQFAF